MNSAIANKNDPKKINNLGDFLVFGWYSLFLAILIESMWFPQMSTVMFMLYGGYTPLLESCGAHNFTGQNQEQTCLAFHEIQKNETCLPIVRAEFYSAIQEFGYFCDAKIRSTSISFHMFGLLIGAILFGQFSDLFGRRKMMLIGIFFMTISNILTSFSWDLLVFNALQTITTFFTASTNTIGMIYLMELFPKKHRFWAILVLSFSPNYVILSIVAYLAHDWRLLLQIIAVTNAISFVLLFLAYESPRWLIRSGKLMEAKTIYQKIERFNGSDSVERQTILEELIQNEAEILEKQKKSKRFYYHHLFATWKLVRFTSTLAVAVFVCSVINYALVYNMEALSGSIFVNNAILGLIRFAINIAFGLLDFKFKKIGRKTILGFSQIIVISALLLVFLAQLFKFQIPYMINAAVILAVAMNSQFFNIAVVLIGELFPTPIRNVADSFQLIFVRIASIFAPHVFWFSSQIWTDLPYIFMATIASASLCLLCMMIPETKGCPMDDHMPPKSEHIFGKKSKIVASDLLAPKSA